MRFVTLRLVDEKMNETNLEFLRGIEILFHEGKLKAKIA
jgi:hypothetical protein